jgi:hypothetical protein
MRTGIAILMLMLLFVIFLFWNVPNEPVNYHMFFVNSNQKLKADQYVYFLFEHITILAIVYMWFKECSIENRDYVTMFLYFQIGDTLDYIINYNQPYAFIHDFPISFNTLSIALYGLFLIYKAWISH